MLNILLKMSLYLGIDLGTSKIAVVLYNAEENRIVYSSSHPHNSMRIKGRFYEIDPIKIREKVIGILEGIPFKDEVKGIGISTQMHGTLIVDKKVNPITPLITWEDKRCLDNYPYRSKNYIEVMEEIAGKRSFYNTGTFPATGFMGSTLFWFSKNNPEVFKKGYKACFLGDYIVSYFTDRKIITDFTCAGSSGFFDIKNKRWLYEIIRKFSIPEEIFPEVKETGDIAGNINSTVAGKTGFSKKCFILTSIGDNQASIIGSAGLLKDRSVLNIGTGSQISSKIKYFKRKKFLDTRYFIENTYILVGAGLSGGKSVVILEKFLKEVGRKIFGFKIKSLYKKIKEIVSKHKISKDEMIFGNFFKGLRFFPEKKGFLAQISEENFSIENFIFSIFLGILLEMRYYWEKMGNKSEKEIIGSGNGFRKNPFGQMTSNLFKKTVKVSPFREEAGFGAAILAAYKKEKNFDIDGRIGKIGRYKVYYPEKDSEIFDQIYSKFKDYFETF